MSSTSRCVPERDAPLVFLGVVGVRPKPGRTRPRCRMHSGIKPRPGSGRARTKRQPQGVRPAVPCLRHGTDAPCERGKPMNDATGSQSPTARHCPPRSP